VNVDTIAAAGDKLWKELVGTNVVMKVTHIGLGFTGLEYSEVGQRSIEGFLKAGQTSKRSREEDGNPIDNDTSLTSVDDGMIDDDVILSGEDDFSVDHMPSFTCSRCGKTISMLSGVGTEGSLAVLRQEHDDFHFAQDLAKQQQPNNSLVISKPSKAVSPRKKRRKDPPSQGGIERFFVGRGAS
jgi:DNA polymerase eta